jgi:hypothetical protein
MLMDPRSGALGYLRTSKGPKAESVGQRSREKALNLMYSLTDTDTHSQRGSETEDCWC